jgi:hypothetical protein
LETGLLKLKKLIFGVGLALCVVAPAAQSQNSAGVTFANDGGAIYVSAKDAAKALNLPLEYDSRSDLVFLGAIPLDHRSAVGNQRFVRLTALAKAGAKVRELAGGKTSIVLKGRELIVKTGRKRAVVDKKTQQLLVYQAGQLVMSSRVSTGRFAGSTPSGKFRMGYTKDAYHSCLHPRLLRRSESARLPRLRQAADGRRRVVLSLGRAGHSRHHPRLSSNELGSEIVN